MELKNRLILKVSLLAVVLLLMLSYPSQLTYKKADSVGNISTIGGIEIGSKMKASEIEAILTESIIEWKQQPIRVEGEYVQLEMPSKAYQFDVKETVKHYTLQTKKKWYLPWQKQKIVHIPLEVRILPEATEQFSAFSFIRMEETLAAMTEHAQYLQTEPVVAEEMEVDQSWMERVSFEIQDVPSNEHALHKLVEWFDGTVLNAGEPFSYLTEVEKARLTINREDHRFFASVLYSTVLGADVNILERHSQNEIPPYLKPGIEVDISRKNNKNFVFKNGTALPMTFNARLEQGRLVIEVYQFEKTKDIAYQILEEQVPVKKIYRYSDKLKAGQERIVQKGQPGVRATVYRTVFDQETGSTFDEMMSKDYYPPIYEVIEISPEEVKKPSTPNADSSDGKGDQDGNDKDSDKDSSEKEKNDDDKSNQDDEFDVEKPNGDVEYDKGGNIISSKK